MKQTEAHMRKVYPRFQWFVSYKPSASQPYWVGALGKKSGRGLNWSEALENFRRLNG